MTVAVRSLAGVIADSTTRFADRPAVWAKGETVSYRELWAEALRIQATLARHADGRSQHIAVFCFRGVTAFASILGVLANGCAYVPLNPRFPTSRNRAMMESAGCRTIILDARTAEQRDLLESWEWPLTVLLPDEKQLPAWVKDYPQHRFVTSKDSDKTGSMPALSVPPETPAYLLFTSGSTGKPKGVEISHGNVAAYLRNIDEIVAANETDRFTQLFDLTFDLSVHDMFVCWQAGACLYVVPEGAALVAGRFVQEHEITIWFSVPSVAAQMHNLGLLREGAFPSLRHSLFCGEALPAALAGAWASTAPNGDVVNLYGPTEATIAFTWHRWRKEDAGRGFPVVPIGRPLREQHALAVRDGVPVRAGDIGELCLSGSQVCGGYWRNAEITKERFISLASATTSVAEDGLWYRTGDMVAWDDDVGFQFLGRADSEVKISGYRVDLQEIENAIRNLSGCAMVAVLGWPRDAISGTTGTVAFASGKAIDREAVLQGCRSRLPVYMVPSAIHVLDELPLNANGKIDRNELLRFLENSGDARGLTLAEAR